MQRPCPPESIFDTPHLPVFLPAPEIVDWARLAFIDEDAELVNEDHAHLRQATIGALWTNVVNSRHGRGIVGQCEMGLPPGSKWSRARVEAQLIGWFGDLPDFVLTFDAAYAASCDDAQFCALVEHELYHAAQDVDMFGAPKFNRQTGRPKFTIRGHDVEEFVGVVRRYGAGAAGVSRLVEAAKHRPEVALADLAGICGTCLA